MATSREPSPKLSRKSRRSLLWFSIGSIVIIVLSLLYFAVLWNGLPLYGWTYSDTITKEFHDHYVHGKVGVDYRVYVESRGMDKPIVHIAVYSAIVYPGEKYSRIAEGYFDTFDLTFEFIWYDL